MEQTDAKKKSSSFIWRACLWLTGPIRRFHFSLTTNIVIGLVMGVACGLFFGEWCARLSFIGDAYVRLLQMTILPFIVVSLIHGIGCLSVENAKRLAWRGGILLLIFWVIGVGLVLIMPLAFPNSQAGTFFNTSIVTPVKPINFVNLYIPENPFASLSDNMIPGVVLFCVCVGISFIGMPNSGGFMNALGLIEKTMIRIASTIVNLTPIGVFAISAAGAGTMTIHQFEKLQVYFVTFVALALLLTFVVLPLLVMSVTKFRYRDVMGVARAALITGFTTGNFFVVLPVTLMAVKELFARYNLRDERSDSLFSIVVPVYFNFPDTGKILVMLFIPFAAWFIGTPMGVWEYPDLAVTGLVSFFGGANLALPFLLRFFHLPVDLFQMYILTGVFSGNFCTLVATMDLVAFSTLCVATLTDSLHFRPHRMILCLGTMVILIIATVVGVKIAFSYTVRPSNQNVKHQLSMTIQNPVKTKVYSKEADIKDNAGMFTSSSALKRIASRGAIRVAYGSGALPFAYENNYGQVVGFDIAMANNLARDLGCDLELCEIPREQAFDLLDSHDVDIIMSGGTVSPKRMARVNFVDSNMTLNMALVVPTPVKDNFQSLDKIKAMKDLTLAIRKGSPFNLNVKNAFPNAKLVEIEDPTAYLAENIKADGLITSAEVGASWCLQYQQYCVVVPKDLKFKVEAAYSIARDDLEFLIYLNQWMKLQKLNGKIEKEFAYWILGKINEDDREPRWCVWRNVLGWPY